MSGTQRNEFYSPGCKQINAKCKFAGRARWTDPDANFWPHQLAFDTVQKGFTNETRKMKSYNKLKLKVLSLLANTGGDWLTPRDAAEQLDFRPPRSAWSYFKRLWRFRLLERSSNGTGSLKYRISKQGIARLQWISSSKY
jgi:hypothetical protein